MSRGITDQEERTMGYSPSAMNGAIADLAESGGGTYQQRTLEAYRPTNGYAVAIGGAMLPADAVTAETLAFTARLVAGEYMTDLVGTWLHDDKVYIDAVRHIVNRERALAIAAEAGQLAIFDFATGEEVTL